MATPAGENHENGIPAEPGADNRIVEEKCARINKVFRDYGINAYPVKAEMVQEAARFTRFAVELKSGETIRTLERYKTDIGIQLEANGEILISDRDIDPLILFNCLHMPNKRRDTITSKLCVSFCA